MCDILLRAMLIISISGDTGLAIYNSITIYNKKGKHNIRDAIVGFILLMSLSFTCSCMVQSERGKGLCIIR